MNPLRFIPFSFCLKSLKGLKKDEQQNAVIPAPSGIYLVYDSGQACLTAGKPE